jgi:hypothetical protein
LSFHSIFSSYPSPYYLIYSSISYILIHITFFAQLYSSLSNLFISTIFLIYSLTNHSPFITTNILIEFHYISSSNYSIIKSPHSSYTHIIYTFIIISLSPSYYFLNLNFLLLYYFNHFAIFYLAIYITDQNLCYNKNIRFAFLIIISYFILIIMIYYIISYENRRI